MCRLGGLMAAEYKVDPKATIFVVSDHGFVAVEHKVNVGVILANAGLVKVEPLPREKTAR